LTIGGTFYAVTDINDGHAYRMTLDASAGTITAQTVGNYTVTCALSFSGSADTKIQGHLFINGVVDEHIGFSRKLGSSGDVGSASMSGYIELNDGDVVSVMVRSTSDDVFISLEHFNLVLRAIN